MINGKFQKVPTLQVPKLQRSNVSKSDGEIKFHSFNFSKF